MKCWQIISLNALLIGWLTGAASTAAAQVTEAPVSDTTMHPDTSSSIIQLVTADYSIGITPKNDSVNLQKLLGHVEMMQNGTLFDCDSAFINKNSNIMDAYGDIHINQDSVQVYGDSLHYLGNERKATVLGNTRLEDGKMVLTTPKLDYDLNTRVGTYTNGGKLVNGTTTLTSVTGYYFADLKQAYFKKDVVLTDPQYILNTDSLQYNSQTKMAYFVAPTVIHSGKSIIYTHSGYYNMNTGAARFDQRPTVVDSSQTITSDSLFYNKVTGMSIAKGNVVWTDTAQKMSVLSGYSIYNDSLQTLMATQKPLLIYQMDKDTLFMASDSLFSAPEKKENIITGPGYLPLKHPEKGASSKIQDTDSTGHRYLKAFFHVRIYSDSLQGVCDSIYYSFRDSTFRMYHNPILWAGDSQMTGDTIYLHTQDKQASRLDLIRNGLVINKTGPNFYNQVQGNLIFGYFSKNQLDWMHAIGNAESIYYAKDDSGAYIGVNKASCSIIDIYFDTKKSQVSRVVFRRDAAGTTYPLSQTNPSLMQLRHFRWEDALRPKSKTELMH
ncbi:MAG TPA: OstA-like protein [Chitinophagaceae bacterium]|nr:OstA-like protein [Chitinophagaceae bacterium]